MSTSNFFEKKKSWSIMKDQILDWYLTPYLAKIARTGQPVRIADCFAGKGRFDDSNLGSPIIILNKINELKQNNPQCDIKAIFIEKKYYKDLLSNLSKFKDYKILEGTYEKHIDNFINVKLLKKINLFLYVDPFGVKSLNFSYFYKISEKNLNSFELLMNFNTFGFLREGCRLLKVKEMEIKDEENIYEFDGKNSIEHFNSIANGNYWQEILFEYNYGKINMFEAEELFSIKYSEQLKLIFSYSINIPIKLKSSNIPKYRLIFCSNHKDGLVLMADNMNRKWKSFLEKQRELQPVLFEYDFPDMTQIHHFDLKNTIFSCFNEEILLKDLIVKLILKLGISFSEREYKDKISELEKNNELFIIRNPEFTKNGRKVTAMDYKKYKIIIKKNKLCQTKLL